MGGESRFIKRIREMNFDCEWRTSSGSLGDSIIGLRGFSDGSKCFNKFWETGVITGKIFNVPLVSEDGEVGEHCFMK